MSKVAIYVRVSTIDKQDYTRQISDCKACIGDKYNDTDIEIFAEKVSGYKPNAERTELLKMLAKIESDPKYFQKIYITEISRLGRDPRTTRNIIDDLTEKKVPIFITSINKQTIDEKGERDSIMNIILQVLIEFADSESKTMKRRTKSGILESIKKGNVSGGKYIKYGYAKAENKQMIVDATEAEIIKDIFDLYKKGNGARKISSYLNEKKIPTRVNKFGTQVMNFNTIKNASDVRWSDKTVLDIITDPIYIGKRRIKGDEIEDGEAYDGDLIMRGNVKYKTLYFDAPAIISSELFNECQYILKSKTHRNYVTSYDYLLKDLMTCSYCGRNMFYKYRPSAGGDKVIICSSRLIKGRNCGNYGVNITYLESVIYDLLIEQESILNQIDKSDKMIPAIKEEIVSLNNQIKIEQSEEIKVNKKIEKLKFLYIDSDMEIEEYNKLNKVFKKSLKNIELKLTLLNKNLRDQHNILRKIDNKVSDIEFVKKLSKNRPEIIAIFKQYVKRLYVKKIGNEGDLLVDIHFKYGQKKPNLTLKILLNVKVSRMKKPVYSFKMCYNVLTTTNYDNGILTNTDAEILDAFNTGMIAGDFKVADKNILVL